MKSLLTIAVTAISMAAIATSSFAGNCGDSCKDKDSKKDDKEKTEQGSAS